MLNESYPKSEKPSNQNSPENSKPDSLQIIVGCFKPDELGELDAILRYRTIRPIPLAKPEASFAAAYIRGDALRDAGILSGDIVIFEQTRKVCIHDLIVVSTPFGLTVKYLHSLDWEIVLRAANDDVEDQVFNVYDVVIRGVVVRVERDFYRKEN